MLISGLGNKWFKILFILLPLFLFNCFWFSSSFSSGSFVVSGWVIFLFFIWFWNKKRLHIFRREPVFQT